MKPLHQACQPIALGRLRARQGRDAAIWCNNGTWRCAQPTINASTAPLTCAWHTGTSSAGPSAQLIEEVQAQQDDADQHAGVTKRRHPQSDATAEFRIELDQVTRGHGAGMGRQRIAAVTPWLHIRAIPTLGMPARVVRAGENTDL